MPDPKDVLPPPGKWLGAERSRLFCHIHSLISAIQPIAHVVLCEVPWKTQEPHSNDYNQNHWRLLFQLLKYEASKADMPPIKTTLSLSFFLFCLPSSLFLSFLLTLPSLQFQIQVLDNYISVDTECILPKTKI